MACQRVNWSSTHRPDCRDPLPDRPLPPKGRWASAPDVELFTDTIPALDTGPEAEGLRRVGGVDRRRQPVPGQVRELDRLIQRVVRAHPDERPEGLLEEQRVVRPHSVDDRWVIVEPAGRIADEPLPRRRGRYAADRRRAEHPVLVRDPVQIRLESGRESFRQHRTEEHVLARIARAGPMTRPRRKRPQRSHGSTSVRAPSPTTCIADRPYRSRRTARPRRRATGQPMGVTTMGFLPPSSRHGDWRWRPHSSPIRSPTAVEPVKPTLSTRRSRRASDRPSNVAAPSACTT